MVITNEIREIIARALSEDIGSGDVTSTPIVPPTTRLQGEFQVKAPGVIAGLGIVGEVFRQIDPAIRFTQMVEEGADVQPGDIVARVSGDGPGVLIAERVALNFLQRMSGIATMTHAYVQSVSGTNAKILDTRKTVPGLRALDKAAVALGGGTNHRIGLYDMVLIKDNHIEAAGGISQAVERVQQQRQGLPIEVEVESLEQLREALAQNVDRIMLDNMSPATMVEAVAIRDQWVRENDSSVELEASGNITMETVSQVANTGVDLISVGALTHSVTALDVSLEITLHQKDAR